LHVKITNEDSAHHFLCCQGYYEFIPQGQAVNQAYYVEMLKWLHESVHRKIPELWPNEWIFHHDNAPTHKALSVKQFLAQKLITEMEQPYCFVWL
jgi:hypothetical protein